jgi:hypothetical protein
MSFISNNAQIFKNEKKQKTAKKKQKNEKAKKKERKGTGPVHAPRRPGWCIGAPATAW